MGEERAVSDKSLKWLRTGFAVALVPTIILTILLNMEVLHTNAAQLGIVSFEFAGTTERTIAIVHSWENAGGLEAAWLNLALDTFLYIPIYSACLAFGCLIAQRIFADQNRQDAARFCKVLAWCQIAIAIFDWIENFALAQMLVPPPTPSPFWPLLALIFTVAKWLLVFASIYQILCAAKLWLWDLLRRGRA